MALPRVYRVVQDAQGNIVPQVLGSVLNHGTGVLAQLYNDAAGTQPLTNPMTSDATYGSFKFYVTPGHYDLTFSKPGYTFEPVYDFQVPDDNVTLGTMAMQNADAVAITGGSATGLSAAVATQMAAGSSLSAGYDLVTGTGHVYIGGKMGFGVAPPTATLDVASPVPVRIGFQKNIAPAITLRPLDNDTGGGPPLVFNNLAGTTIGSIQTNATATTYNTSSDARLKTAAQPLTGALDVLRRLRPVTHLWRADGSRGYGFLAHEVQQEIPDGGVVTGEPDAVDDAGQIVPMGMDNSKLVPWIVGAIQEVTKRLEALEHGGDPGVQVGGGKGVDIHGDGLVTAR